MYTKDFETWHKDKQGIDQRRKLKPFKEMDIWWASLGVNVGHEIDGKNHKFERPVLVIKKINRSTAYVVPLTSTVRPKDSNFVTFQVNGETKSANISQVRMIDIRRFRREAKFRLSVADFKNIVRKFTEQFEHKKSNSR